MEAFKTYSWKEGKTFRMALCQDRFIFGPWPFGNLIWGYLSTSAGPRAVLLLCASLPSVSGNPPRGVWEAALELTGIWGLAPAHFPKTSNSQTLLGNLDRLV